MKLNYITMHQTVRLRKHEVNKVGLVKCLRSHKNMSNAEISSRLHVSKTKVEHWFRTDECFAIPDPEIWFELKKLLNIDTDEFDKSITEFILCDGVFEKSERVYMCDSLMPTLTTLCEHEKVIRHLTLDSSEMTISQAGTQTEQKQHESAECQRISTSLEVTHKQRAAYDSQNDLIVIGNMMNPADIGYAGYRVYGRKGISPCICASGFKRDIFVCRKKY